ncbi:MAG: exodeoxyribonuclease beta chain [Chlamydiota bacterium]
MQSFDPLAPECPLWGPHLLEASAGTGKTFSIEHIIIRMILAEVPIETILCVTFTRAAARELKERIRRTIIKAIAFLKAPGVPLPWLYLASSASNAVDLLELALATFTQGSILTIHAFCHRMLQEYAFEANLSLDVAEENLEQEARYFLRHELGKDVVAPEQLAELLGANLAREIIKSPLKEHVTFARLFKQWQEALRTFPRASHETIVAEFAMMKPHFKGAKEGLEEQAAAIGRAIENPDNEEPLRELLRPKIALFDFIAPANRKVKAPAAFDLLLAHIAPVLGPILKKGRDKSMVFNAIVAAWHNRKSKSHVRANQYDQLVLHMAQAVKIDAFKALVQKRYKAVIIDEFQDTDAVQWEIFRDLFLDAKALYLVGDPKQSIYQFRGADLYTYMAAKQAIGSNNWYRLDTNFRSSKELVVALNAVFEPFAFPLPKTNETIPYHPVQAGAAVEPLADTTKGALHWIIPSEHSDDIFSDSLLPYTVCEIERLMTTGLKPGAFAILVRDRHEAKQVASMLRSRSIEATLRSREMLAATPLFAAFIELFEAIARPTDIGVQQIALRGPWSYDTMPWRRWHQEIKDKGLAPFFRELLDGKSFCYDKDCRQIIEELLVWEQEASFSFTRLIDWMRRFQHLDTEEGKYRRVDVRSDAVHIMTMHMSKGLEFDVVFAIGLATISKQRKVDDTEEINAEKLRQFYVAATRAKQRLYLPYTDVNGSPIELFERHKVGARTIDAVIPHVTKEIIQTPFVLAAKEACQAEKTHSETAWPQRSVIASRLYSFTTLAKPIEVPRVLLSPTEGMPAGKETGVLIHAIYEAIFQQGIWHQSEEIQNAIASTLAQTPLVPWQATVQTLIQQSLETELFDGFKLQDLRPGACAVEVEFLYQAGPHFIKGYIDLLFRHNNTYYCLDWKTNRVDTSEEEVMTEHDYWLQASLYSEAIQRHLQERDPTARFGGAIYFFIRTGRHLHFIPETVGQL